MSRISYINGLYKKHYEASVHLEDRGNQFADGVYEVIPVRFSKLIDCNLHLERLFKNINSLKIDFNLSNKTLKFIFERLIYLNKIKDGIIYLQVSRGVAKRDHAFPDFSIPTIFVTSRNQKLDKKLLQNGVKVVTTKDLRWAKCDIKTISLLPNVLAKQEAYENNAYEALLVDDESFINEGSSSNFWIVKDNIIYTGPITNKVLPGITRKVLKEIINIEKMKFKEERFKLEDAYEASEAMLTNSSNVIIPVVKINNKKIGSGIPGNIVNKLYNLIEKNIFNQINM